MKLIKYNGQTNCINDWARIYKVNASSLGQKIREGLTVGQAVAYLRSYFVDSPISSDDHKLLQKSFVGESECTY